MGGEVTPAHDAVITRIRAEYLGMTADSRTGATMATRICARCNRTFEIALSGTPTGRDSLWTVDYVYDKSLNEEIQVPDMDSVVALTEDAAFACICDCIEKWLRLKP
jgi:hypothetical protein